MLGIGVGVPGIIDPVTNVAVRYDLIRGWSNVPLGARLAKRFGVPVFLENNIRSMALAELWFGGGRGLRNFVCVGIRSGIAAGVVVNGRLLHGAQYRAGEIGHWVCPVPAALAEDAAQSRQRLAVAERHAAGTGRVAARPSGRRATRLGAGREDDRLAAVKDELTIDDVLAAARDGDAFALSSGARRGQRARLGGASAQ